MAEAIATALVGFVVGFLSGGGLWAMEKALQRLGVTLQRDRHPPSRITMLGREYRLNGVSGPAWLRECNRDDPLTYTYYPVPRTPTD
jgi:hypothetical protein